MANLKQTTLSAALTANALVLNVASATGISGQTGVNPPQKLYVVDPGGKRGELMTVVSVNGTAITVSRIDEFQAPHASGSIVLIAPSDPVQGGFSTQNVQGTPASTPLTLPHVNITTGDQFLLSIGLSWVAGFNSPNASVDVTAAVASASGAILPTGPLFHVTGTAAVTGFTIPVGFAGGSFTIIPDGTFTWTTAGNIGLAGTAVVGKLLTFTWDQNAGKFYPSYVA